MAVQQVRSDHLSSDLRSLVSRSVALLGEVIQAELGDEAFDRIEKLRLRMTRLRGASLEEKIRLLRQTFEELSRLTAVQRLEIARSYSLMLELMNACETDYRNQRIRDRHLKLPQGRPDSIIYVLTAHPTEARSSENIWVFHQILRSLHDEKALRHWLEIAWMSHPVRSQKPTVQDEAGHVYSTLLNESALAAFLRAGRTLAPVYARSWVGGDKDGHPGVDAKVFVESLQLSREHLCVFIEKRVASLSQIASVIGSRKIMELCRRAQHGLRSIWRVKAGDLKRVHRVRSALYTLLLVYEVDVGALGSEALELQQLLKIFPAFVVPLEFRESSEVLMSSRSGRGLAIFGMLQALARLSRRGDPRWYVRGFIISMAASLEHIQRAASFVSRALGKLRLPVIPLFEQSAALADSPRIVEEMLRDRALRRAIRDFWDGNLEVMLGYSDSSKENGVLPSRLKIAKAMHILDDLIRSHGFTPIFFQGSGGSVDRGGGTIADQTVGWSASALRNYKVTLQGEMVERSLASPEIIRGQIERIVQSAGAWRAAGSRHYAESPWVHAFSERVASHYRAKVKSEDFLRLIEKATPYPVLDALNIGSRPAKRAAKISLASLRAIPWVLCWTQTRVLFPTWWGVGSAWREASSDERAALKQSMDAEPVFATFVRTLGFTLVKVEFAVWRVYLEQGGLSPLEIERAWHDFRREYDDALGFAHAMLGEKLLAWRPWLEESIVLRSAMIHPLNILQILALQERDFELLRLTLLGVSSGMMSTG